MPRMLLNAKNYYEHQKGKPKLLKKYHIKKNNKPVSSMIKTPGAQLVTDTMKIKKMSASRLT